MAEHNATVHNHVTSNIVVVANAILVNMNGSGPTTNTAPNPVTTRDRSIAYRLGPDRSAINMSGELAIPIPGSATPENRLVAIGSGSESSTVGTSASVENQVRGPPATRDSERAIVQPPSKSSTIDVWRQNVG